MEGVEGGGVWWGYREGLEGGGGAVFDSLQYAR